MDSTFDSLGHRPLSFPDWSTALDSAGLNSDVRANHRREIGRFFRFCKMAEAPATVILARQFLERCAGTTDAARKALHWLFLTGKNTAASPSKG